MDSGSTHRGGVSHAIRLCFCSSYFQARASLSLTMDAWPKGRGLIYSASQPKKFNKQRMSANRMETCKKTTPPASCQSFWKKTAVTLTISLKVLCESRAFIFCPCTYRNIKGRGWARFLHSSRSDLRIVFYSRGPKMLRLYGQTLKSEQVDPQQAGMQWPWLRQQQTCRPAAAAAVPVAAVVVGVLTI